MMRNKKMKNWQTFFFLMHLIKLVANKFFYHFFIIRTLYQVFEPNFKREKVF